MIDNCFFTNFYVKDLKKLILMNSFESFVPSFVLYKDRGKYLHIGLMHRQSKSI